MNDVVKDKLKMLPDNPGCYLMKDEAGKIIYVGKAVNLKNRVRSYFHGSHDAKTSLLVENIADFETVIVNSEEEALILEANMIKQHMPRFNILLRDDKHYPYLRLTLNEDFPRLVIARHAKPDGSLYFGPYPNVGSLNKALNVINSIFPLRTCKSRIFRKNQRACLNYHIGRCCAPCEGLITKEDYNKIVNDIASFLQGKTNDLIKAEKNHMQKAAEELRFEDAAAHRDSMEALIQVQKKQLLDFGTGEGNCDILAVESVDDVAVVHVFFLRGGTIVNRGRFFLNNAESGGNPLLMQRFILEYYGGGQFVPPVLYCNILPELPDLVEKVLSDQCGHKVSLTVPVRGDKKRLLNLVEENARMTLQNHMDSRLRQEEKSSAALEELRNLLKLTTTPARIECYDISHIQGTHIVGSMVVFHNGVASKKDYRRFKIKTLDQSNDFAALQEVLERRWQHGWSDREKGEYSGFAIFPDLIVIDGGKGQLSSVCQRMEQIGAHPNAIISLAKREEEVFVPHQSQPIILDRRSPALQLLQNIRDEAHRFAITYHRNLRGKNQTKSVLDEVPFIGEKRKKSLLKVFESLENIRAASLEELAAVPLMNKAAAEKLYYFLLEHPKEITDNQK